MRVTALQTSATIYHPMPATRSTTRQQRKTQNFRQNIARQDRGDYYKCNSCGNLFSRYHNAHKRHVCVCEAQGQRLRVEEAQMWKERHTPTPEPYTHVSDSEDIEFGLGAGFAMEVAMDHGVPIF